MVKDPILLPHGTKPRNTSYETIHLSTILLSHVQLLICVCLALELRMCPTYGSPLLAGSIPPARATARSA